MGGMANATNAHGGVIFGVSNDNAAVILDPLFNSAPYPPLPPIQMMQNQIKPKTPAHVRICCYGFDASAVGFAEADVKDFITEKVRITQVLFAGNSSSSVLLTDTPAHFFDDGKGTLWLVFKTKGTAISRWEALGRSLECTTMRLISAHPSVKVGTRGFAHVIAHFGLNEKKANDLYQSQLLDIGFVKSEVWTRNILLNFKVDRETHSDQHLFFPQTKPRRSPKGEVKDEQQQDGNGQDRKVRYDDEEETGEAQSGKKRKLGKSTDHAEASQSADGKARLPTGIQARYKTVRSMRESDEHPAGMKTPKILHATPAPDTGDDDKLPVVRSLTDSFSGQTTSAKSSASGGSKGSPHRTKKESRRFGNEGVSSPPRDKTKSRATGGPSPKRDHGKARAGHKSTPTIVPSSIVERCVEYISDKHSIQSTLSFLEEFKSLYGRTTGSAASGNALEIINFSSFEALKDFVEVQGLLVNALRERYCIPIENFTPTGIVPNHHNWSVLRDSDQEGHASLSTMLKDLTASVSEAFGQGFFLFDPVSISFFLAIQSLHFRDDRQSRHNPFLEFACQGLAHVRMISKNKRSTPFFLVFIRALCRRISSGYTRPLTASSCCSSTSPWTTRRSPCTPICLPTNSSRTNCPHVFAKSSPTPTSRKSLHPGGAAC